MSPSPDFRLNGREVSLAGADPRESLLRWLNRHGLTGTKEGCGDGDCGACTVALVERGADGAAQYQAVNSCLLPVGMLPGREVITVEALAERDALHPVQQAMVECAGSQCGYCTPGFVMSLFAGYYAGDTRDAVIEGNLCRCTGYKPIREAAALAGAAATAPDRFRTALALPRAAPAATALGTFFNPTTVAEALALKAAHPDAAWICGATDLGVSLSHGGAIAPAYIALDRIAELAVLEIGETRVRIGAGVSLSTLETQLSGVFPALDQMLPWFAGRQVRNRSTLGGNLGTASPIGDLLPVLLALDAEIHCRGPRGARSIAAEQFFLDYRRTARADDELIVAITVPRRADSINASYKVAKRQTDDISIVAAVFALGLDPQGRVRHARLAYGGVAATPLRATRCEAFLLGRQLDEATLAEACSTLETTFEPLSDHRASAAYRRRLCGNLFAKFIAEHCR